MRILLLILFFTLVVTFPSSAADILHGRSVYVANCASCHGGFGKGDGPKAATFDPKPTNFTDPKAMANVTPERIEKSVVQGLPGITEHTFGHLLIPQEVRDVIGYIRSFIR